jgi:hypothetical protein
VWVKQKQQRKLPVKVEPIGYKFVKQSSADFAIRRVGNRAGEIYQAGPDQNKNSHYFIRVDHPGIQDIKHISSNSKYLVTGPLSLSKQIITKYLNRHLKNRYNKIE